MPQGITSDFFPCIGLMFNLLDLALTSVGLRTRKDKEIMSNDCPTQINHPWIKSPPQVGVTGSQCQMPIIHKMAYTEQFR
jgi:hypothetical protein